MPEAVSASPRARRTLRDRLARSHGPWRVAVVEASMLPGIAPDDWLLVDPTTGTWPRRGSLVVIREPDTNELAIKRLAAGPGDTVAFAGGRLLLADDEAWLASDASTETAAAAGHGEPRDSRRYGPVPLELLVARAWFRYSPWRRIGRLGRVRRPRGVVPERPASG